MWQPVRAAARLALGGAPRRARAAALHASPAAAGSKHLDWYIRALRAEEAAAAGGGAGAAAVAAAAAVFPPGEPLHGRKRARAYLDLQFGRDDEAGAAAAPPSRVVVELADDLVPVTVANFLALCERPVGAGYRGSEFFYARRGFGALLGDWARGDGRGGESALGARFFADENTIVRHAAPGVLTMANAGVHSNSSVVFVTLAPLPHLDGRHVAFGRVLLGLDAIERMAASPAAGSRPLPAVVVRDAGRLPEAEWARVDAAVAAAAKAAAVRAPAAGAAPPVAAAGDAPRKSGKAPLAVAAAAAAAAPARASAAAPAL